MKTIPTTLPIFSVKNRKNRIDPKPAYQRGAVWGDEKKQLLIDTIIRGYDIPKFYLRKTSGQYDHEVVDGQQRLRSLWSFVENQFPLGSESKDFKDLPDLEGKLFKDLDIDLQDRILAYPLSITEIDDASEEEVRELFLRLQEGTSLNPAEKRNAMQGNMRDFIHELAAHPFFLKTHIKNNRFQFDDFSAHVSCIALSDGPANVTAADLKIFYEQQKDFDSNSNTAKKIKKCMGYLDKAFTDKTPELDIKWGFVDLFLLIWHLIDSYDLRQRHSDVSNFYTVFENERRSVTDTADLISSNSAWKKDLYDYITGFQREGAKKQNIADRHDVYVRRFLHDHPDLTSKDKTRQFNRNERIVIWRNGNMRCANPSCGKQVDLEEMHADHVIPHAAGGLTDIANGQCLCGPCNQSKSDT